MFVEEIAPFSENRAGRFIFSLALWHLMRVRVLPLLGGCGHPMAHSVSAERSFAHGGRAAREQAAPSFLPTLRPLIIPPLEPRPSSVSKSETLPG